MWDPERIGEGSVTRSLRLSFLATLSQKTRETSLQLVTTESHSAKVFMRLLLQLSMPHFAIFGSSVA